MSSTDTFLANNAAYAEMGIRELWRMHGRKGSAELRAEFLASSPGGVPQRLEASEVLTGLTPDDVCEAVEGVRTSRTRDERTEAVARIVRRRERASVRVREEEASYPWGADESYLATCRAQHSVGAGSPPAPATPETDIPSCGMSVALFRLPLLAHSRMVPRSPWSAAGEASRERIAGLAGAGRIEVCGGATAGGVAGSCRIYRLHMHIFDIHTENLHKTASRPLMTRYSSGDWAQSGKRACREVAEQALE